MAASPTKRGEFEALLASLPTKRAHRLGPIRWCKRCSRFHRSRAVCDLYRRKRTLKDGKVVTRWAH